MTNFKSMDEVYKYLNNKSVLVMQEVIREVKVEILQAIKMEVYDAYDPLTYERRYANKGLADETNFEVDIDFKSDGIEVFIRNNTKPSGEYKQPYLDLMIVDGTPNMPPRDFYEEARRSLEVKFPLIVQRIFKKHGITLSLKTTIL